MFFLVFLDACHVFPGRGYWAKATSGAIRNNKQCKPRRRGHDFTNRHPPDCAVDALRALKDEANCLKHPCFVGHQL